MKLHKPNSEVRLMLYLLGMALAWRFAVHLSRVYGEVSPCNWTAGFYHFANNHYIPTNATFNGETSVVLREVNFVGANTNDYLFGPLTTTDACATGDLRGAWIVATLRLEETGSPIYRWRADNLYGPPRQANVILFLSTATNFFQIQDGNANPLNYWWSSTAWIEFNELGNYPSVTLVSNLEETWTAAHGESSKVETNAWEYAKSHVGFVGFIATGSHFGDLGTALKLGSGQATLHLELFEIVRPPLVPDTNDNQDK